MLQYTPSSFLRFPDEDTAKENTKMKPVFRFPDDVNINQSATMQNIIEYSLRHAWIILAYSREILC